MNAAARLEALAKDARATAFVYDDGPGRARARCLHDQWVILADDQGARRSGRPDGSTWEQQVRRQPITINDNQYFFPGRTARPTATNDYQSQPMAAAADFKTDEAEVLGLAGSIPVRLR
ncbi:hypothetical protein Pth03_09090 [Planotetraspora thailandica]|uniref:Uncharacterized protein n=1 Tax=Planotetraspora thailandica TaxID=487172 RepID=A0A8J3XTW1_9ACTN|nr:hypothetical protein Pth03_09090 [Planotetraspora thailandica]